MEIIGDAMAEGGFDVLYTPHIWKLSKFNIFIHDMVLVSLWHQEIFPELYLRSFITGKTFCGITSIGILQHGLRCAFTMCTLLICPPIVKAFGPNVLDLIDCSLGGMRNFMKLNPKTEADTSSRHV